ncbi:MAG TPA: hypothetical protein VEF06_11720, partial [Bryobacteraceae bacterium]|nr:hypothetical protein [Bryobacteraceae bacterium]
MKFFDKAVRQFFSIVLLCAAAQAYEYGPDPGYTGAPGDQPSCAVGGSCHVGTPNSYTPGGVKIVLPGGSNTYVPGQTMTIQVQITDARMKSYGFQLTARLA